MTWAASPWAARPWAAGPEEEETPPPSFPVVLSLPTYVPGSITATGVTGQVTATEA